MTSEYERGTAPLRIGYLQEDTVGQLPSTRNWQPVSDNFTSVWNWQPDANTQRQDAAGEILSQGFFNGAETHEVTHEYDLQQWFYDGNGSSDPPGDTLDPIGDFLQPENNALPATHAWLSRSDYQSGGNDGAGYRVYTVGKGGHPDSVTIPYETEDGSPINVDPSYQFEKVRRYTIHQPSSSTTLDITNNGSLSVTVDIEDEDANTTESNTVGPNSTETTTASFSDIDAVELDSDVDGDVVVTDGSGTTLMTIEGQNRYPADEGDLGVPTLSGGSHASAVGGSYISFIDDTLTLPNLTGSEIEVVSGDMQVSTGLSDNTQSGKTARRNIHPESWEYVYTLSLAGEHVHVDQAVNYLTERSGELLWNASEGHTITSVVRVTEPGEYTKESDTAKLVADNEFTTDGGITVSTV